MEVPVTSSTDPVLPLDLLILRTIFRFNRQGQAQTTQGTRVPLTEVSSFDEPSSRLCPFKVSLAELEDLKEAMSFDKHTEEIFTTEQTPVRIKSDLDLQAYVQARFIFQQMIDFTIAEAEKRSRESSPASQSDPKRARLEDGDEYPSSESDGSSNGEDEDPSKGNDSANNGGDKDNLEGSGSTSWPGTMPWTGSTTVLTIRSGPGTRTGTGTRPGSS